VLWQHVFQVVVCVLSAVRHVTRCPALSTHTTTWKTCYHNTA